MTYKPLRYIGAQIVVNFLKQPQHKRKPPCPDVFYWQDVKYQVIESVGEWFDYGRSGAMAHNMRPANLKKALRRGSWGVGKFYFRVMTDQDRIFEIYYDRAPKNAGDRDGSWFLDREMIAIDE